MASTKEMQACAKAAKNAGKSQRINTVEFLRSLFATSQVLIQFDCSQGYIQTPNMTSAANMIDEKLGKLSASNYNLLLELREDTEKLTSDKYGVDFVSGAAAFMWDAEEAMRNAKVPQPHRVMHGLLDLVIAKAGWRCGAIVLG